MWKDKDFDPIIDRILSRQLGTSISMMENYLLTRSQHQGRESLTAIQGDYNLLTGYWKKGFDDPQREQLYEKLLQRLYALVADCLLAKRIQGSYVLSSIYTRCYERQHDFSPALIRSTLETYVSEVALLELEPEHVRQQRMETIYEEHNRFMRLLFGYLCCSSQWKESESKAIEELLLAPTVDVNDQQLMVSAITLSLMNIFDIAKFRLLLDVYQQTSDEQLRQRAFVGWVLSMDDRIAPLYPEVSERVGSVLEQETCRKELIELQVQMVYCMAADDDSRKIQNEIIPDLMRGNNMKMTRQGLVEMDEDKLENILHPEESEKTIERMEASMRKMADMQRRGSDIYFAGFSQMKRFPFFSELSNWFVPFDPQHPDIRKIWNQSNGKKFLQTITKVGAFCDSDKYSFVLAFDQVLSHMPPQMMEMIEKGEATPMAVGGEVPMEEQQQPAFIRRTYLQNLYRFFRLFSQRSEFCSPFEYPQVVFFARSLLMGTSLEKNMMEVAVFLGKQKRLSEAVTLLERMKTKTDDGEYYLLLGQLKNSLASGGTKEQDVCELFRKAKSLLAQTPEKKSYEMALKGYARYVFRNGDYADALAHYEQLLAIAPENRNYQLNAAICQLNLGAYEEALKVLYKLNYEDENDPFVNSAIAWALTLVGKYEQARHQFDLLLAGKEQNATDLLNYGYCLWFQNDIAGAISMFRQYVGLQENGEEQFKNDVQRTSYALLKKQGISDVEIQLMLDVVG